jgi:hypothetical protein
MRSRRAAFHAAVFARQPASLWSWSVSASESLPTEVAELRDRQMPQPRNLRNSFYTLLLHVFLDVVRRNYVRQYADRCQRADHEQHVKRGASYVLPSLNLHHGANPGKHAVRMLV